jgi:hypothetical protein
VPRKTANHTTAVDSITSAFEAAMAWIGSEADVGYFWFRGAKSKDYELIPGAYRRLDYSEMPPLLDFVQEGRAYTDIGELENWRTYYLAQHHGIPTRLLDWTESFVSALFFALDGWDGNGTPCVWILRSESINELSVSWRGLITPEQNRELDIWLPKAVGDGRKTQTVNGYVYDNRLPLAIYPRKDNMRIVSQQGTFTVHGTDRTPLDAWLWRQPEGGQILHRIELRRLNRDRALGQLRALGARRHTIYPDIGNYYILYLREKHKW